METNALYFGDNLKVLSERLPDGTFRFPSESVDLVYLDPPFNSNRDYNLIFKEQGGPGADAQIKAFTDSWHWGSEAREALKDVTVDAVNSGRIPENVGRVIDALVRGIGHNDMSAYLVMMVPRLVELHRLLKATGSLWLHCDPTASHYLKIILDVLFDPPNYINEVVWKRTHAHSGRRRLGAVHDVLLVYGKTPNYQWRPQRVAYSESYVDSFFKLRKLVAVNIEPPSLPDQGLEPDHPASLGGVSIRRQSVGIGQSLDTSGNCCLSQKPPRSKRHSISLTP